MSERSERTIGLSERSERTIGLSERSERTIGPSERSERTIGPSEGPDAAAFGTDLRLRPTPVGDLDLAPDGRGDLAVAAGVDGVVQALTLRLLVRAGELAPLGWPEFGSRLHELVGEPDLARTRLRAAAYVREALAADPRVAEVTDVEVVTDRVEARVHAQVRVVDAATVVGLSVAVPLAGSGGRP